MNQKEMEHLTYLTRRYREACFGVQRAMAIAAKCTARLTHAPGGSTGSQVENGVELLMEARRKRDRIRQELESERQKLSVDISKLSSERQQLAATLRWVKGWPMAKIEVEMGCSRQAIYKLLAIDAHSSLPTGVEPKIGQVVVWRGKRYRVVCVSA